MAAAAAASTLSIDDDPTSARRHSRTYTPDVLLLLLHRPAGSEKPSTTSDTWISRTPPLRNLRGYFKTRNRPTARAITIKPSPTSRQQPLEPQRPPHDHGCWHERHVPRAGMATGTGTCRLVGGLHPSVIGCPRSGSPQPCPTQCRKPRTPRAIRHNLRSPPC